MITEDLIHEAQKKWGDGIVKIGSLKNNVSECVKYTTSFLNEMYDFKNNNILFKPTKASVEQFRPTFKIVSSIPGIDITEPDLTDKIRGFSGLPI